MAVRGAVQAVDGLGGDTQRRVEAKGGVGAPHVVVDGLGQRDDIHPVLAQVIGVLLRAAAPQADQRVEMVLLIGLEHDARHVHGLVAHGHLVGLVAAGAQDGAAHGEDTRERWPGEAHGAVLHQPAETVAKADDLHAVCADARLAHATDRGVEPRAVAAGGEDAYELGHGWLLSGLVVLFARIAAGLGVEVCIVVYQLFNGLDVSMSRSNAWSSRIDWAFRL